MTTPINRWIALSIVVVLVALAANGARLYDAVNRLIAPPPADIIIIAPVGSEIV